MINLKQVKAFHKLIIGLTLLVAISTDSMAAPDPALELRRQQEREQQVIQQNQTYPDVRIEVAQDEEIANLIPKEEKPCFQIKEIILENINGTKINRSSENFNWALNAAHYTDKGKYDSANNRCLGSKGINLVMKRIQNSIIAKGYVTTRVLAMPQDLKKGQLRLTVVPGTIRDIRFKTANPRATYLNAIPMRRDNLLNLRDIEQGLENFKRLPTAEADIQIHPSKAKDAQPGESDLEIAWQQGFPFRLNLFVDNSGSENTGKYQGGATFSYDNFLTLNDLFYVSLNHDLGGGIKGARGTKGRILHYSIPYGYWLISLTASQNSYHQTVIGSTTNYIYSGDSENAEVKLSRMVYRDAKRKIKGSLSGWVRQSKNYIDNTEVEVQRRRMAGFELGVNLQEYNDRATLNIDLAYRWGINAMDAIEAPEENFGEGTSQPGIIKFRSNLNYPFVLFNQPITFQNELQVQRNLTPLVPQDRFSIGSRYTVRGFDGESAVAGDYGWLIRNNLLTKLGQSHHQAYIGVDYGSVGGQNNSDLTDKDLSGIALGIKGSFKNLYYDSYFARHLIKPENFTTDSPVFNFNLNWSF